MLPEVIPDENPSIFPAGPRRSPRRPNRYSDRPIGRVRFSGARAAALPRRESALRDPRTPAACLQEALAPHRGFGADDSRNFEGARTDCLKPECSAGRICKENSNLAIQLSCGGGEHSWHSGLSSPETPRPRSGGESPTAGTTRDACADLHLVRRKSSVNGNSGLSSFGGTTIMPAVWPVS